MPRAVELAAQRRSGRMRIEGSKKRSPGWARCNSGCSREGRIGGCGDEENHSNCRIGEHRHRSGRDVECAGSGAHLRLQRMRGSSQPLARAAGGAGEFEYSATQPDQHRRRARAGRTAPAGSRTGWRGVPRLQTQTRSGLKSSSGFQTRQTAPAGAVCFCSTQPFCGRRWILCLPKERMPWTTRQLFLSAQ